MFNHSFLAASKEFECVNTSKMSLFTAKSFSLVIPMRYECSLRSVSVYGACGESISAVGEASCSSVSKPGVKLALSEPFRELFLSVWKAFKEVDKAACTHV